MAKTEPKQHVPIFVGSTFEDLKDHRKAVRDALHQLETIVRGMEYFGSKPRSPVEECLAVVRSCSVYIGIFAMRYGSIPKGYDLSMTHLEYEEAQRIELPSLIYLIDVENQPVLPKHVETGVGAQKLEELKKQLCARHTISFYTTPMDLASKILHDLPPVLEKIGTKVEGRIQVDDPKESIKVLERFRSLPKIWHGKEVNIEFVNEPFSPASVSTCEALKLKIGATLEGSVKIKDDSNHWSIYVEGDVATSILDIPKGARVQARAMTIFGIKIIRDYDLDLLNFTDPSTLEEYDRREIIKGLLIKEIQRVHK